MEVNVDAQKKVVTLRLTNTEVSSLSNGGALAFTVSLANANLQCQLLLDGSTSDPAGLDHRLFIAPGAIGGVAIGGRVSPMFPGVPFGLVLEPSADFQPNAGPVQVAPGVSYQRVQPRPVARDANIPRSINKDLSLRDRLTFGVPVAGLCFGLAFWLRDYPSSLFGFGALGLGCCWMVIEGLLGSLKRKDRPSAPPSQSTDGRANTFTAHRAVSVPDSMHHDPTEADFVAGAAIGAFKGPVLEEIAALRAGNVQFALDAHPLKMVSACRALAIIGDASPLLAFDAALSADANPQLMMELGVCLMMVGELPKAITRLHSAAPQEPTAYNSVARGLACSGDMHAAIKAAERGLASMPGDVITRNTLKLLESLRAEGAERMESDRFPSHAALGISAAKQLISGWDVLKLAIPEAKLAEAALGLMERGVALDPSLENGALRESLASLRSSTRDV